MRIPGFSRPERRPADSEAETAYLERRPGESGAAFEDRLAAAAAARQPVAQRAAYVEGRQDGHADERARDKRVRDEHVREEQVRARRAERPRRRGGGLGFAGVIVALVAVLGVLWLVLAARHGSFAAGGAVVDQKIAEVTSPAKVAADQAIDRTGQAVQNAGQALQSQGQRIRQAAP